MTPVPHLRPRAPTTEGALTRAARVTLLAGACVVVAATVYLTAVGIATPAQALVWQGATYLAWVPPALALAWTQQRLGAWPARALVFLPATLLHGLASAAITWLVLRVGPTSGRAFVPWAGEHVVRNFPVEALHYWAIAGLLAAVEMHRALRERERAAARLEAELAQARLATLRARLQPHFLFNTLQSIALLIPRDPVAARRMTVHLGDLLRAAFAHGDTQEIALADELALVRAYLEIEAMRFRDRLTVRWELDAAPLDARIPDLLLQPLVENALRHGLWPTPGHGTLAVRVRHDAGRLVLEVEDDGVGLPADWRDGAYERTGLGATRARLLALYGAAASLQLRAAPGRGTRATVSLPLRRGAVAASVGGSPPMHAPPAGGATGGRGADDADARPDAGPAACAARARDARVLA